MLTADLDYELPPALIATEPAQPRDAAKLMVINRQTSQIDHRHVCDLPDLLLDSRQNGHSLRTGDLLVFNQSRVLPAGFNARRTATQGSVQGLYLNTQHRPDGCYWDIMLESGGKLREGEYLDLDTQSRLELTNQLGSGRWLARLESTDNTATLLSRIGQMPLPPYIRRQRRSRQQPEVEPVDTERYNTVFASDPGSVAAPTAGLHFTPELFDRLDRTGVRRAMITLHVGLATFAPVRTERIEDHPIHEEWFSVPPATLAALHRARTDNQRIISVGTTTVRALESLPQQLPDPVDGDYCGQTRLLITPGETPIGDHHPDDPRDHGFGFRFTDALMTNFHLPRSTLLALVAALPGVGLDQLKDWYRLAIEQQYRFYSYGDAMLIL